MIFNTISCSGCGLIKIYETKSQPLCFHEGRIQICKERLRGGKKLKNNHLHHNLKNSELFLTKFWEALLYFQFLVLPEQCTCKPCKIKLRPVSFPYPFFFKLCVKYFKKQCGTTYSSKISFSTGTHNNKASLYTASVYEYI